LRGRRGAWLIGSSPCRRRADGGEGEWRPYPRRLQLRRARAAPAAERAGGRDELRLRRGLAAQSLGRDIAGDGSDHNVTFGYNSASQIVTLTARNDAYAWTRAQDVSRAYKVNGLDQYVQVGPAGYGYDVNGNLTFDGWTSFVYDAENRLVSAGGTASANLAYDPLGRLWQISGGAAGPTQIL
jgi:hypothetical protein